MMSIYPSVQKNKCKMSKAFRIGILQMEQPGFLDIDSILEILEKQPNEEVEIRDIKCDDFAPNQQRHCYSRI